MLENRWPRGDPELARRVKQLVALGFNRREISEKLRISAYLVDRLRRRNEPDGGASMDPNSERVTIGTERPHLHLPIQTA